MNIINKIKTFLADENGAETMEWVVVAGVVIGMASTLFGNSSVISLKFNNLVSALLSKVNSL